jgi:hypothetical protein
MQKTVGCYFSSCSQTRHAFSDLRKKNQDTVAVLMCANMDEAEKMPLLVTGK